MNCSEKGRTHRSPLKQVAGSCVGAAGLSCLSAPSSVLGLRNDTGCHVLRVLTSEDGRWPHIKTERCKKRENETPWVPSQNCRKQELYIKVNNRDFPDDPVAKTLCS